MLDRLETDEGQQEVREQTEAIAREAFTSGKHPPGLASPGMELSWRADDRFEVDGVSFISSHGDSTREAFCIRKPRALVETTVKLLERSRPQRILEIGIASGGSAALLALVARPERLVAIERDETPVGALTDLIGERSLPVSAYYGVDQGDRERLSTIVTDEFGRDAIDLVIDDASHLYEPTRASFETLFPRVRPGGTYVIEDWNWQLRLTYALTDPAPAVDGDGTGTGTLRDYFRENVRPVSLEVLALQLMMVRACSRDLIADLFVDESQVVVTRGPAPLDPDTFSVTDHFADPHHILGDPH
jgi:predicted O-methyltransferase YrrM